MSTIKLIRIDLNTGEHKELKESPTQSKEALLLAANKLNKTAYIYKLVYYVEGVDLHKST